MRECAYVRVCVYNLIEGETNAYISFAPKTVYNQ